MTRLCWYMLSVEACKLKISQCTSKTLALQELKNGVEDLKKSSVIIREAVKRIEIAVCSREYVTNNTNHVPIMNTNEASPGSEICMI